MEAGLQSHRSVGQKDTRCLYKMGEIGGPPQRLTHPMKQLGWKQGQSCGLRGHHRAPLDVREPEVLFGQVP